MHCKKLLSVAIAGALLLAGCDRSVDTYNYRLSIYPSMGLMKNVKIRVYAEDGRTLLVKGKTGFTGMAGLSPGSISGPVVVAIQAHNEPLFDPSRGETIQGSWYFDESLGSYVRLPSGTIMRAILPTAYGEYGVTPLTELAYRIAVDRNLFPLSTAEARAVNKAVSDALAPEIADIVAPPALTLDQRTLDWLKNPLLPEDDLASKPPFVDLDDYLVLDPLLPPADNRASRYALQLAALASLGAGQARPMLAVQNALAADVLDGTVDGLDKNGNALSTPYNTASMVTDMNVVLNEYGFLPTAINLALSGLDAIDDGSNFTGCSSGNDDPALPSDIKGVSLMMSFEQGNASAPYQPAEKLRFSFCSDGQLRLDERYYVLASDYVKLTPDPSNPALQRFRWHQSGNGLVYELVTIDDVLYEVNLYGSGGDNYLGRFVE